MGIPTLILRVVKDLIRTPDTDTTQDATIQLAYETELRECLRESDLMAATETLDVVADQDIYMSAANTTRILAVLFEGRHLLPAPSQTVDLLPSQDRAENVEPEIWIQEKIAPGIDDLAEVSPQQFEISPVPTVDSLKALTLYTMIVPDDGDVTVLRYLTPYLIYRTVARFTLLSTEMHDTPASQFWASLAKIWHDAIVRRVP